MTWLIIYTNCCNTRLIVNTYCWSWIRFYNGSSVCK